MTDPVEADRIRAAFEQWAQTPMTEEERGGCGGEFRAGAEWALREAARRLEDEAREHEGRAIAARVDPDYDDGSEIESALAIVLRKQAAAIESLAGRGAEPGA